MGLLTTMVVVGLALSPTFRQYDISGKCDHVSLRNQYVYIISFIHNWTSSSIVPSFNKTQHCYIAQISFKFIFLSFYFFFMFATYLFFINFFFSFFFFLQNMFTALTAIYKREYVQQSNPRGMLINRNLGMNFILYANHSNLFN